MKTDIAERGENQSGQLFLRGSVPRLGRHAAFYKVISAGNEVVESLNLINDQPYRISINVANLFHP